MPFLLAGIEYRHDVRVRQHAGAFRLAQEPRPVFQIVAKLRFEDLDRDGTTDFWIVRPVDASHRAFADDIDDLVTAYAVHAGFAHDVTARGSGAPRRISMPESAVGPSGRCNRSAVAKWHRLRHRKRS